MNKELRKKTNEELCALIVRLKLQLLESRFRMASGELEKTAKLVEIRKTIARALTILNERHIKVSFGSHGVNMHDLQTGKVVSISDTVMQQIEQANEPKEKVTKKSETKKAVVENKPTAVKAKVETEKSANDKPTTSKTTETKKPTKTTTKKNFNNRKG